MSENPPMPASPDSSEFQPPAPVFDPDLFPSRHRPFRQWLLDHNPCLLLSTVLMLLGCYLVNSAIGGEDNLLSPLALLLVINIYEACIIPLGLLLIRRTRGTARDGWWLLLFEVLFLVNATFVNVDFRTGWGVPINVLLFVLACVKAAVVMRGLKIGLSLRTFGFFALQLGLIYGMPIFFAYVHHDGVVSPVIMYTLWWLVGLLPGAYNQIARRDDRRRHNTGAARWDLVQQVIRRVYLITPWVLLVVHLRFAHWAHHATFQAADFAPILLGITVASLRLNKENPLRIMAKLLPIAAVILATIASMTFPLEIGGQPLQISPLHLTLVAAALTYGYMAGPFYFLCTLISVWLGALAYLFHAWIFRALAWLARTMADLIPTTALAWGIATIIAAFALLGVGSLLSLKRTAPPRLE